MVVQFLKMDFHSKSKKMMKNHHNLGLPIFKFPASTKSMLRLNRSILLLTISAQERITEAMLNALVSPKPVRLYVVPFAQNQKNTFSSILHIYATEAVYLLTHAALTFLSLTFCVQLLLCACPSC